MVFPQKNARHLGKKTVVRRFRRKLRVVSEENNIGERERERERKTTRYISKERNEKKKKKKKEKKKEKFTLEKL